VAAIIEGKSWGPQLLKGKVGAAPIEGQSWWPPLLRGKFGGRRF